MKTIKKVSVRVEYVQYIPDTNEREEGVIYVSKEFNTAVHNCLCGCKEPSITPLTADWWTLTDEDGKVTMTPSILNKICPNRSHYIITKGIANFV